MYLIMELALKPVRKQSILKKSSKKMDNELRLQACQIIEVSDSEYNMIKGI